MGQSHILFEKSISQGEMLLKRLETAAHTGSASGFASIPVASHPRVSELEAWYGTATALVTTAFGFGSEEERLWASAIARYPELFRIATNGEDDAGIATLYARVDHIAICLGALRQMSAALALKGEPPSTKKPLDQTLYDRVLVRLKNSRFVVAVLMLTAVVTGIASFRKDLCSMLPQACGGSATVRVPEIPGGSAWILVGDFSDAEQKYVRGPFFAVDRSPYASVSLMPRKGELIKVTVTRRLVIPDFGYTGTTRMLDAPWAEEVLGPEDYIGIDLPAGAVVEVRDVTSGATPGMPSVVWVRVAQPPS